MSTAEPNNPSGNLRVFPEVSLTTKAVALNGAAIFYQLTCKALKMNRGYELHIDVLDGEGRVLGGNLQLRDSEKSKEPAFFRQLGGTESAGSNVANRGSAYASASDGVGILVDPAGRIGEVDSEGRLFFYEGTPRAASEIRLRLTAKVRGKEAYAMWIIGQARVTRVRGWNDPQVLRALGRRPWPSEGK